MNSRKIWAIFLAVHSLCAMEQLGNGKYDQWVVVDKNGNEVEGEYEERGQNDLVKAVRDDDKENENKNKNCISDEKDQSLMGCWASFFGSESFKGIIEDLKNFPAQFRKEFALEL